MSVEVDTVALPASRWVLTPQGRQVLRYALGATICMTLALGIGWPLSFMTPVLALGYLAAPARLSLKDGVGLVLTIAGACGVGLFMTHYVMPFPLVFLPLIGLVLFRLFYAKTGGASPLLITWLLIALLALPLVGMLAQQVAVFVALGIITGAVVTVVLVWLIWAAIPAPPPLPVAPDEPQPVAPPPPTSAERFRSAMLSTAVVFPALVAFYTLQWTGSLLVLIFIAMLSLQPAFAANFKAGGALIIGNVIGGLAAIAFYELLVMVPAFPFMVLLTLLSGLLFGAQVFSGKKTAGLFGMAFSTVLLVIGSTTGGDGEAGAKVTTRVIQIMIAVIYVVSAFGLLQRLTRGRRN